MNESTLIPVDHSTAQFLAQCGEVLINVVQRKFGICAVLQNIENSRTAQMSGVKRCSVHLSGGPEVSVWKDDLTTHRVDAVVNAANELLSHGAGLAGALSRAGGPQIQKMSNQYIKEFGKVATGEAVITPPGALPCKAIIHAVGPHLSDRPNTEEVANASRLLKRAVEYILYLAERESFQSVAIPALSSGLFNFPLDRCAEIIVNAVKDYRYGSQLSEVRLVNHDEPTVSAMEKAFREILESKASYSGAVKDVRTSVAALPSLQMGSVTMHIKTGHIEQEKVDVIVNTISPDLNLFKGDVSKAILKKAGNNIQKEIHASQLTSQFGDVIETSSHHLDCSRVYHTVCAVIGDNGSKILRSVVRKCLDKAVKGKYSSISFPAIGTGNLGFKKEEVAKLMIGEVADFAKQHKGQKVDVYFVLFPSDLGKIKAFQNEMAFHKGKQSSEFSTASKEIYPVPSGSYDGGRARTGEQPCIELRSAFKADQREAARWIAEMVYLTSNKCTILNNHILYFGQKEHAELQDFQAAFDLSIREFLKDGIAGVTITGPKLGVREAALRVEALCCEAQEEFARTEESAMMHNVVRWRFTEFPGFEEPEITGTLERALLARCDTLTIEVDGCDLQVSLRKMEAKHPNGRGCHIDRKCLYRDNPMDLKFHNGSFYQRTVVDLKALGYADQDFIDLDVVKIEKVENPLLKHHFQQKERQVSGSPKRLYQQVPAQFCDLVCRVGFQRQYSPPKEQKYGAGIYFGGSSSTARKLAEHLENEEYMYIFQAQVLTGKGTMGSPDLIIPPALGSDPLCRYDSVNGGRDTHVIFNSHQALPVYLLTCRKHVQ
ncbi:protein mono-ADP-ribosyltransferase PARP9 isoform X1 [Anguilla anguilla]|uniref:protein mono-ADP-ribosyltransferase PARP9 isoform X1 n=1 Tax=Anguilla anguilla TaxID=7936 RepID=UPI0015AD16A3|nr:protein mono-ADP-ribosyltransferase PARP9 isoform X1 [Anguilla anguilla]